MNKIFIGGLSWNTNEEGLANHFSKFGNLEEVKIITDRETGRSRGFGFITFDEADAASQAISEMDGAELDGRNIRVSLAEERQGSRGPRSGGGRGFGGGGRDFR